MNILDMPAEIILHIISKCKPETQAKLSWSCIALWNVKLVDKRLLSNKITEDYKKSPHYRQRLKMGNKDYMKALRNRTLKQGNHGLYLSVNTKDSEVFRWSLTKVYKNAINVKDAIDKKNKSNEIVARIFDDDLPELMKVYIDLNPDFTSYNQKDKEFLMSFVKPKYINVWDVITKEITEKQIMESMENICKFCKENNREDIFEFKLVSYIYWTALSSTLTKRKEQLQTK